MRRCRNAERSFATTSWDVHAAGLSTTRRPSMLVSLARLLLGLRSAPTSERGADAANDRRDVVGRREAGGEAMAAAVVLLGDVTDVDLTERTEAHAHRLVDLLLQHARHLGLRRSAQDVDQTFDLFARDAVADEHVLGDRGPDEALLTNELGPGQGLAQQLQVCEAVLLEQRPRQTRHRHVERHELARQVEDLGRGGVVLETAGVAHERGVEAKGGRALEWE